MIGAQNTHVVSCTYQPKYLLKRYCGLALTTANPKLGVAFDQTQRRLF